MSLIDSGDPSYVASLELYKILPHPVAQIRYSDAKSFCEAMAAFSTGSLDCRLLTEAEWEYAYRAGTVTTYYNGDSSTDVRKIANFRGENAKFFIEVGLRGANAFGLHDFAGNVREWCEDYYGEYDSTTIDPKGPKEGTERVHRGGSRLAANVIDCSAAARDKREPEVTSDEIGFRIAISANKINPKR